MCIAEELKFAVGALGCRTSILGGICACCFRTGSCYFKGNCFHSFESELKLANILKGGSIQHNSLRMSSIGAGKPKCLCDLCVSRI